MRSLIVGLVVAGAVVCSSGAARASDATVCADGNAKAKIRIDSCTRVIQAGKTSGNALANLYSNRGIVYLGLGDLTKAIKDFDEAIKLNPRFGDAYYNRGIAHSDKGDFKTAEKDFGEAIKINPSDAGALGSRCYARAIIGTDLQGALADCNASLKLAADGYTSDSRGLVHLKLGKFQEAKSDFEKAVKADPKSASALYGRGVAKQKLGDTAGGAKDIASAKAIDKRIADTYAKRGVTL